MAAPEIHPKPFRVYSSPFYRCLATIQPSVEHLMRIAAEQGHEESMGKGRIEKDAVLNVRLENGLGLVVFPGYPVPTVQSLFPSPSLPRPSYILDILNIKTGNGLAQQHSSRILHTHPTLRSITISQPSSSPHRKKPTNRSSTPPTAARQSGNSTTASPQH